MRWLRRSRIAGRRETRARRFRDIARVLGALAHISGRESVSEYIDGDNVFVRQLIVPLLLRCGYFSRQHIWRNHGSV